jgi:hypothetical protein
VIWLDPADLADIAATIQFWILAGVQPVEVARSLGFVLAWCSWPFVERLMILWLQRQIAEGGNNAAIGVSASFRAGQHGSGAPQAHGRAAVVPERKKRALLPVAPDDREGGWSVARVGSEAAA